ncbi:SCP2 sterol-binding domain-containing protein [Pseudomonas lalucatii]|uniref:Ubiquinone biosynthesis accessory factor UbiJ n=1 Tax=Pseudomonas lalucatii TaxID=1424203 RepID=A0ABS5Q1G2_9PSED|nr:SCP2 sterol-binding domain-containing protein [Pseudomonas lalucatii]MBS7662338.1 SCP2 sterol-binding domain-containing protein [Pseudomonas lalucatii]MBS7690346.1 SCP2 sterol-binding domain-containing protein [Pseudomonas lalucatii]MBS7725977.1 SCP2 sterol-binding domain-containing protein [Pseudomonas lalucatii]QVM88438.1 SCP2 sterol-binding domain-containing protein [Pseudomonas lalucatii]
MLLSGLLAGVEQGLNRVLALDGTALPRLARLRGRVIEIDCRAPALQLFILADEQGLRLAPHWAGEVACRLRAPANSLLRLAASADKSAVLHSPEVELDGDSAALLDLAAILQDLELDWEYELARWLGPVGARLLAGHLRSRAGWTAQSLDSLRLNLADYLSEESRSLVGRREADARFAELDRLKLALDRLDARIERIAQRHKPNA